MADSDSLRIAIANAEKAGRADVVAVLQDQLAKQSQRESEASARPAMLSAASERVTQRIGADPAAAESALTESERLGAQLTGEQSKTDIAIAKAKAAGRLDVVAALESARGKVSTDLGARTKQASPYYDQQLGETVPVSDISQAGAFGKGNLAGIADLAGLLLDIGGDPMHAQLMGRISRGEEMLPTGGNIREMLGDATYTTRMQLPDDKRAAAAAGETVGGGLGFLAPTRAAMAVKPATAVGRQTLPLGAELASIFGAGTGAGIAESGDPGDAGTRFGMELAGSALYPGYLMTRYGLGYAPDIAGRIKGAVETVKNPNFRDSAAAKALVSQIKTFGEDPEKVAAAARQSKALSPTGGFTTDIETGSTALVNLRNDLARSQPGFKDEFTDRNMAVLSRMADEAAAMAQSGDPEAINRAADLYGSMFTDMLESYKAKAVDRAKELAGKLGKDPAEQLRLAGIREAKAINDAYDAAKKFESSLWEKLPKNIKIAGESTMAGYRAAQRDMLPGQQPFSKPVTDFVDEFVASGIASSGDMLNLRNLLLNESRKLMAAGDRAGARHYGEFADSVLDDLSVVPGSDAARAASRAKHDAFTRTFAGEAGLTTSRTGAERVDPETLAARTLAGGAGGVQRLVRAGEVRGAAAFDPRSAGLDVPDDFGVLSPEAIAARRNQAQQAIEEGTIADMARNVDPLTGRVRPAGLAADLADTQSLNVPQAQQTGQAALSGELSAQRASERVSNLTKKLADKEQSTIAMLSKNGGKSTSQIIGGILGRGDFEQQYGRLVKLAGSKRLKPEVQKAALDELKAGTLSTAVDKAVDGNKLSFGKLRESLLSTGASGKPSLIDVMEKAGTLDKEHAQRIRQFVTKGALAEKAIAKTGDVGQITSPSAIQSFIINVAGARIGSAVGKVLPGPGNIQTPGYGAKLAQWMASKAPQFNINEVLKHAINDPDFLVMMLESPAAKAAMKVSPLQRTKFRRVTAGMVQAGLMPKEDYEELNASD